MTGLHRLWPALLLVLAAFADASEPVHERLDLLQSAWMLTDDAESPAHLLLPEQQRRMLPLQGSPLRERAIDGPVWLTLEYREPAEHSEPRPLLLTLSSPHSLEGLRLWGDEQTEQSEHLFAHLYGRSMPVLAEPGQTQRWIVRAEGSGPQVLEAHMETPAGFLKRSMATGAWLFTLAGAGLMAAGSLAILQYRRHSRGDRPATDLRWLLWPAYILLVVAFGLTHYMGLAFWLYQAGFEPAAGLDPRLAGMSLGLAALLLFLIWWQQGEREPWQRQTAWLLTPVALALGYALGPWPFQLILFGLCLVRLSGLGVAQRDVHSLPVVGAILSLLIWLAVEVLQTTALALTGYAQLLAPTALLGLHTLFVYQSYFVRYRTRPLITRTRNPLEVMGNGYTEVLLRKLNHDLRSPIHGVLGMTNLLSETHLNRDQQEYVATTHNAGIQMLNLADEMRALTRISSNSIRVRPREVELEGFLHEVVSPFARLASQKSVEVVTEVLSNVPGRVLIDSDLVSQVLRIILDNSVKFTEEGVIEVAIRRDGQQRLRLRVDDTGRGIPEHEIRRLFEFQGLGAEQDPGQSEIRLGLPIAAALVRAMGGQIGISRAAERGSSVWISLPFEAAEQTEAMAFRQELEPLRQQLVQQKVLVVDDHLASRKVLEDQTRNWGMQAELASSGKEALAILQSHMYFHQPFDWVIIDYRMPEMNGLELLEKIRAIGGLKNLRVIVMTGVDLHYVEQAARDLGAVAVLAKPVNSRELMNLLREEGQ